MERDGSLPFSTNRRALEVSAWLAPWLFLVTHLSTFWTLAPEYQYGWCVAPLAVYLLSRRWPPPGRPTSGNRGARWFAAAFAALILPIWWIRVAAPDWSAIGYLLAGATLGYALSLWASRVNWDSARSIAFPVCFILSAVPWPQRAENFIIQSLTRIMAAGSVEVLQWLGISAVQTGNLVSLSTGTIGISEACSGVRSIQSLLVAALCLGEVYRLKPVRRFGLVGAGLALALCLNLLRNVILSLIAASRGIAAVERWHDSAGWSILLVSLLPLFILAKRMRADTEITPQAGTSYALPRPLPLWAAACLTIWFLGTAAGVEIWYRVHERMIRSASRLEIHWPAERTHFQALSIPDRTRDLLLCSAIRSVKWTESDRSEWTLTWAKWAPGRTSAQSARMHRPEVCLQATGAELVGTHPMQRFAVPGGALEFEPVELRWGNQPMYYFYTLYEESNRDDLTEPGPTPWSRVRRAFLGQRNLGQQTVEVGVRGYKGYEAAVAAARREIPLLLKLTDEVNH